MFVAGRVDCLTCLLGALSVGVLVCAGPRPADNENADGLAMLQASSAQASNRTRRRSRAVKPNILYIVLDQWRWDWAGFNDESNVALPRLSSLASKGVRFDYAYSPAPLCVPSRCAFAAGRSAHSMWVADNSEDFLPGQGPTYMQLLQKAGYRTMGVGKDHLNIQEGVGMEGTDAANDLGIDVAHRTNDKYEVFGKASPSEPYGAYLNSLGLYDAQRECYGAMGSGACCNATQLCQSSAPFLTMIGHQECGFLCTTASEADEHHDIDTWTAESAKTMLKEHLAGEHASKPWYLSVGFTSPHPPFIMSPSMSATAQTRQPPAAVDQANLDSSKVLDSRRAYSELVEKLDSLIGEVLDFLDTSGHLQNTLVIVTSDHGEHLGDRGHFAKSSAWDVSTRVPLVVSGPGVVRGKAVSAPVETLDLVGTMLEFAGTGPEKNMETMSLKPFLTGQVSEVPRKDVRVGLASRVEASNFSSVVRQFNASTTLKLVCCPTSEKCIKGGQLIPTGVQGEPQVALTRLGTASPGDLENVMAESGRGCEEARDMLQSIAAAYQASCTLAIDRLCSA